MPHLSIFGVTVPVASGSRSFEYAGEASVRQFSGAHYRSTKARKNMWRFQTVPVSQAESQSYQQLIAGEGFYVPARNTNFSGLLGTSQGHFSTSVGTVTASTEFATVGANDANKYTTRAYVQLPAGIANWTLFGNFSLYDGSARRFIMTSAGAEYENGSTLASAFNNSVDRVTYDMFTGLLEFKSPAYHPITGAPDGGADWAAGQARNVGSRCHFTTNNRVGLCTTAGTTGGSQPTMAGAVGSTATDGTVTWTLVHTGASTAVWNCFLVPYVVPSTWVSGINVFMGSSIGQGLATPTNAGGDPALPNVVATGFGFQNLAVCRGQVTGIETLNGAGGTPLEAISFSLMEV